MGAKAFDTVGIGVTAEDAFLNACTIASQEAGVGTFETGTILEKVGMGLVEHVLQPGETADSVIHAWTYRKEGHSAAEQYDPALYIDLGIVDGEHRWRFWGMAAW